MPQRVELQIKFTHSVGSEASTKLRQSGSSACVLDPLYYIYYILSPEVCGKELVFAGDDYISGQVENQGLGLLKQSYSIVFNKHLFCSGVRINLLPKFIIQL